MVNVHRSFFNVQCSLFISAGLRPKTAVVSDSKDWEKFQVSGFREASAARNEMTKKFNKRASCFRKEVTERGSAELVKPQGLAPKLGEGVKGAGARRAATFTSHDCRAGMVHFSSFIVQFPFGYVGMSLDENGCGPSSAMNNEN